jgi:hypothetical protein
MGQLEAETRPSLKKIRKDTNLGNSINQNLGWHDDPIKNLVAIYILTIYIFFNKNNFVLIYIKK